MTAIEYYKEKFTDMTVKLDNVKNKDDINDVVRFTGIFLRAAQLRKKVIAKDDARNKMYQSKAERNADKNKDADKNNNSSSAAPVTSSETPAPSFSYNDGE